MPPETLHLEPDDGVPNHPRLPVLIHPNASNADPGEAMARDFETRFAVHGWPPRWLDSVYDFHHGHSTAHELLGIAAGHARLMPGGPDATRIAVSAVDVLLLPAGTGHCRVDASGDFVVIGAYSDGQDYDMCRSARTRACASASSSCRFRTRIRCRAQAAPPVACGAEDQPGSFGLWRQACIANGPTTRCQPS